MCPVDFNMIEGGFKQSGIYPFNGKAITPAKLQIFLLITCRIPDDMCQAKSMPETLGQVVKMKYI